MSPLTLSPARARGAPAGGALPRMVMRVRAERCAIRGVCWQPDPPAPAAAAEGQGPAPSAAGAGSGGGGRLRSFATASQWGELKIWDPEDPFVPVLDRFFSSKVMGTPYLPMGTVGTGRG